jgi:pseudouridine synthase
MKERVQKLMAQANIGSRRASEDLIRQGRVRVNGETIELGAKADPKTDTITVDGDPLKLEHHEKIYIALNKPINMLSTHTHRKDDKRPIVPDLVPHHDHLFMIGRLDAESQGLMVLTNDGDLANRITHPRYRHTKTYKVTVYGLPSGEAIEQWERGVYLPDEEGKTAQCSVKVLKGSKGLTMLEIVMTEGKKRQIRRVASHLGYPVRHLTRTHIGQFALGNLPPGEWREMDAKEVALLSTPNILLKQQRVRSRPPRRRNKR